jgi:hypothetical protein
VSGGLERGSMVRTGAKQTAAGETVSVRITWTPNGADRVTQRWEFSRDATQLSSAKFVFYTRQ